MTLRRRLIFLCFYLLCFIVMFGFEHPLNLRQLSKIINKKVKDVTFSPKIQTITDRLLPLGATTDGRVFQ